MAQLVARLVRNEKVRSSNLLSSTTVCEVPRIMIKTPAEVGVFFMA